MVVSKARGIAKGIAGADHSVLHAALGITLYQWSSSVLIRMQSSNAGYG